MHGLAETLWQQVMALGLPSLASFSVEILPEIDSTNSELMRRARAGRCEPTLLIAERQTAGRGRMGRSWQSSPGDSLTFSLGMNLSPASWEGLSLAVGTSVAQSLSPDPEHRAQLKWPNDVWWQGRKLAGILIETTVPPTLSPGSAMNSAPASISAHASAFASQKNQQRYCVVGIGINIAPRPADPSLAIQAAWLQELSPASSPQTALGRLFAPLLADLLEFERAGFAAFSSRFAACDGLVGREVSLSDGVHGRAQGVDSSGALMVHTSHGIQRVASLEVSVHPQTL